MKKLYIFTINIILVVFILYCIGSVLWQSVEKSYRKKQPTIVFFYQGSAVYKTETTIKDAELILKSNSDRFDSYEVD